MFIESYNNFYKGVYLDCFRNKLLYLNGHQIKYRLFTM